MDLTIRDSSFRSDLSKADVSPARLQNEREQRTLTRQELQDLFAPELRTIKPLTHAA